MNGYSCHGLSVIALTGGIVRFLLQEGTCSAVCSVGWVFMACQSLLAVWLEWPCCSQGLFELSDAVDKEKLTIEFVATSNTLQQCEVLLVCSTGSFGGLNLVAGSCRLREAMPQYMRIDVRLDVSPQTGQ